MTQKVEPTWLVYTRRTILTLLAASALLMAGIAIGCLYIVYELQWKYDLKAWRVRQDLPTYEATYSALRGEALMPTTATLLYEDIEPLRVLDGEYTAGSIEGGMTFVYGTTSSYSEVIERYKGYYVSQGWKWRRVDYSQAALDREEYYFCSFNDATVRIIKVDQSKLGPNSFGVNWNQLGSLQQYQTIYLLGLGYRLNRYGHCDHESLSEE